jgi:hypothetical protein
MGVAAWAYGAAMCTHGGGDVCAWAAATCAYGSGDNVHVREQRHAHMGAATCVCGVTTCAHGGGDRAWAATTCAHGATAYTYGSGGMRVRERRRARTGAAAHTYSSGSLRARGAATCRYGRQCAYRSSTVRIPGGMRTSPLPYAATCAYRSGSTHGREWQHGAATCTCRSGAGVRGGGAHVQEWHACTGRRHGHTRAAACAYGVVMCAYGRGDVRIRGGVVRSRPPSGGHMRSRP